MHQKVYVCVRDKGQEGQHRYFHDAAQGNLHALKAERAKMQERLAGAKENTVTNLGHTFSQVRTNSMLTFDACMSGAS